MPLFAPSPRDHNLFIRHGCRVASGKTPGKLFHSYYHDNLAAFIQRHNFTNEFDSTIWPISTEDAVNFYIARLPTIIFSNHNPLNIFFSFYFLNF